MSDAKFNGFRPRLDMKGYTQIPNEFFDEVLGNVKSLSELKVLLAIFRKTYGWVSHIDPQTGQPVFKEEDAISMSQFAKLTGLSTPSCVDGVKRAMEDGYIQRVREGSFHGGNSSLNESAVYRVRQLGEEQEAEQGSVVPTEILNVVGKAMAKQLATEIAEEIKSYEGLDPRQDMSFNNVSDTETNNPQDLLAEFFPQQAEEEPKKKTSKKSYKDIPVEKWNANHLLTYFNNKYSEVMGFGAGPITNKLRVLSKKLQEGYDNQTLVKVIDYYLENYKSMSYLPEGYPNFNILFGYRQSIIPEALNPTARKNTSSTKKGNMKSREYQGDTTGDDKGGYDW